MPRKQRFRFAGIPQLVHQRGHNGGEICRDRVDFQTLYGCIAEAISEHECDVHAYALLRRGFFLLVTPREPEGLSRAMQSVGRQYVPWFNSAHGRSGALWEGRYRACVVEPDLRVVDCYRFVEQQRDADAGAGAPGVNRWSSASAHTRGARDSLITEHPAFAGVNRPSAGRPGAYARLASAPLAERVSSEIAYALERCLAYASESYKDWIESSLDHPVRLRRPGRPRRRELATAQAMS